MTLRTDIARWFNEGIELGATHLIVAVDRFDYEDYPVYAKEVAGDIPVAEGYERVKLVNSVRQLVVSTYSGQNMQGCMEVYKLSEPMDAQLDKHRCFNY